MFFDLSDDQEMLRDSVRGFLAQRKSATASHGDADLSAEGRRRQRVAIAEQGLIGAMFPEWLGGGGASAVEAVVVAEEFGRVAHPVDLADGSAAVQAILGAVRRDHDDLLRDIGRGARSIAWASATFDQCTGKLKTSVVARASDNGVTLEGTVRLVQDADIADALLVDAAAWDGLAQFVVAPDLPGLRIMPVDTIDVGRAFFDVSFDQVALPSSARLGEGDAATAIEAGLALAAVLTSADSVGAAARALEMTVAYVNDRIAFGKPIGSFQAVKHRCARMLVLVEAARVAVWRAAITIQDDAGAQAAEAVSAAKFYANDAAMAVAGDALQLHGGIGMTWELDLHVLLKRIRINGARWGTSASHRERVAARLRV